MVLVLRKLKMCKVMESSGIIKWFMNCKRETRRKLTVKRTRRESFKCKTVSADQEHAAAICCRVIGK